MSRAPLLGWRFAPTAGGAEQGNSPGQQYFANDAVTKMVREVLQNSLDHPVAGLDSVQVEFKLVHLNSQDFGADQLKSHISASLEELRLIRDTETIDRYEKMLEAISKHQVPCLAVIDSGTSGLQGDNWSNLIFREGMPTNSVGPTKGGSFGFGKNAPFNLSNCNTVIYSTRYVSRAANGKVQHMAGRSQLISHNNPLDGNERLQNIGFYAIHDDGKPNLAIAGSDIPEVFRLTQSGTGVFIVAFDPHQYHNWADLTARATVSQFFYAIYRRKLVVVIDNGSPRIIDQDSLDIELDKFPSNDPTPYYVQSIREAEPELTMPSGRLDQMGQLIVWTNASKGAPKRTAHINRRGMLISQERSFGNNPFYPSGGTAWPHWCAVTMANDEKADRFIRRMEPPAHDAIHYQQLRNLSEQQSAEIELRHQRGEVARIIKSHIDNAMKAASDNVEELSDLFPDLPDLSKGIHDLKWHIKSSSDRADSTVEIVDQSENSQLAEDPNGASETEGQADSSERKRRQGADPDTLSNPTPKSASPKPSDAIIRNARIVRTGSTELKMTFTTPERQVDALTFAIKSAGEQYQKNEETILVSSISGVENLDVIAKLVDESVVIEAPPDTTVTLSLELTSPDSTYNSYSIVQLEKTEAAS